MTLEKLKWTLSLIVGLSLVLIAGGVAVKGVTGQVPGRQNDSSDTPKTGTPDPKSLPRRPTSDVPEKADEDREQLEEALDRKKVEAELLELEIQGHRETIERLRRFILSLEDPPQGTDPDQAKAMVKSYEEARRRAGDRLESSTNRLMKSSINLGRLRRQIERESRLLGRDTAERANSSSIERRLRSLEASMDRLINAVEKKAR